MRTFNYSTNKKIRDTNYSEAFNIKELSLMDIKFLKEAAFGSGKAPFIVKKLAIVISKRLGINITPSLLGIPYRNSEGKFIGFLCGVGNRAIQFNFFKIQSDVLHSIDIFQKQDDLIPDRTVNLMGFNIIQVLPLVIDAISGEYNQYDESVTDCEKDNLTEARRKVKDMVIIWLNNSPDIITDITQGKSLEYKKLIPEFHKYIKQAFGSNKSDTSEGSLQWNINQAINTGQVNGLNSSQFNVPTVSVERGRKNDLEDLSPELLALYNEIMDPAKSSMQIFEDIEDATSQLIKTTKDNHHNSEIPGMFIHGKAGVGKTYTVLEVFDREGVSPIMIDSPLQGYKQFFRVIANNRDGRVLIFDDNDTVLQHPTVIAALKKFLEPSPRGDYRKMSIEDELDIGTSEPLTGELVFTSKIIFISNMSEAQIEKNEHLKAIKSRLSQLWFNVYFTADEILSLIKTKLTSLKLSDENLTDEMRFEVFDFVSDLSKIKSSSMQINVDNFNFRSFNACLSYRTAFPDNSSWKKRTIKVLSNITKRVK